jgi:hypothetical protein
VAVRQVGKCQCRRDYSGVCCGCVDGCGRAFLCWDCVARAGGLPPGRVVSVNIFEEIFFFFFFVEFLFKKSDFMCII